MMNDISQLTEYTKSVMLARFCGLRFLSVTGYGNERIGWQVTSSGQYIDGMWSSRNLYAPSNMALAWRVLNWAINGDRINIHASYDVFMELGNWLRGESVALASMPPAEAQRLWLDKVLELAIEAGKVTAVTPDAPPES